MTKYQDYIALLEQYPYFTFAAIKALPLAPDEESKDRLRRLIAVNVGNPADAAEILGLNSDSLADFYPDLIPPKLSTMATIETFLSTFGDYKEEDQTASAPIKESVSNPEVAVAPASEFNLEEEYAVNLESGDNDPVNDSTTSAIDAFLKAVPPPAPKRRRQQTTPPAQSEESPALTESFARILIKNRNYEKALKIIQDLNLNNPEKSVYFADQIRFLKKLILNESRKKS